MSKDTFKYSEAFLSVQGEGHHTGKLTVWLRLFSCNLSCNGFLQQDPTDPSTYTLPFKNIDLSSIDHIEDLPVFEKGCDSSYSWSSRFKHLQKEKTASEIVDELQSLCGGSINRHHESGQPIHLCFTGGEPLLPRNQKAVMAIMEELMFRDDEPVSVTFETNGTQMLSDDLLNVLRDYCYGVNGETNEVFFSVSPKLFSVSGESSEKAITPECVQTMYQFSSAGQLKFVVNGTERAWNELKSVVDKMRSFGVEYPIWIMPVGATVEGQKGDLLGTLSDGEIASEAIKRGYNVSARVQNYLWGNTLGV